MSTRTPPAPQGQSPQALYQWALEMREFIEARTPRTEAVTVGPVGLQHQRPTTLERASQDGILMYDQPLDSVVVSTQGVWEPLARSGWVADRFVVAQYASMGSPTNPVTIPATTWTRLVGYATVPFVPRGIVLDATNGTFQFAYEGVYEIIISLAIVGHDSSNAGRSIGVRLLDTIGSTTIGATTIGIGRNQEDTNFATALQVEIGSSQINLPIAIELGGTVDSVTSIDQLQAAITLKAVSEWRTPSVVVSGGGAFTGVSDVSIGPEDHVSVFLDDTGTGSGVTNAVGDYSVTPAKFKLSSSPPVGFDVYRMIVSIEDTSGMAAIDYGNMAGNLTNGVVVRVEDGQGGIVKNLTPAPVVSNADWGTYCYDVDLKTWSTGNELLLVRWTFERAGAPIQLRDGQELVVYLSDDFTGLVEHRFLVQGLRIE